MGSASAGNFISAISNGLEKLDIQSERSQDHKNVPHPQWILAPQPLPQQSILGPSHPHMAMGMTMPPFVMPYVHPSVYPVLNNVQQLIGNQQWSPPHPQMSNQALYSQNQNPQFFGNFANGIIRRQFPPSFQPVPVPPNTSTTFTHSAPLFSLGNNVIIQQQYCPQSKYYCLEDLLPPVSMQKKDSFSTAMFYGLREGHAPNAEVISAFNKLDFDVQVRELMESLALNQSGWEKRRKVLKELEQILRLHYPRSRVLPFGSFLTGLGDDFSDIDIYFDAYDTANGGMVPCDIPNLNLHILDTCAMILANAKINCDEDGKPALMCHEVEALRKTRVPIVKFRHQSGVNCDMSFENITSVRNTLLISFYIRLHPIVRPLLTVVRFWAQCHDLIGSFQIKNYTMVLLVLTFLQNRNVIPSVYELQRVAEIQRLRTTNGQWQNPEEVNGWDTSFADNVSAIRTAYSSSIDFNTPENELLGVVLIKTLKSFFNTFGTMDFSNSVISPFVGCALEKALFRGGHRNSLPDFIVKHKRQLRGRPEICLRSPLTVQDPFILNHNVGGVTSGFLLLKFQKACKHTSSVIESCETEKKIWLLDFFKLPTPNPPKLQERKSSK